MLYDLKNENDRNKAFEKFTKLAQKRAVIELTEKTKRTIQQNKYLHVILSYFGMELGYTNKESKDLFKRLNKEIFNYEKNGIKFIKSSADLSKEELTKSIDHFRRWSLDSGGLYIPEANEQQVLQQIEIKVSQNKYL